MGMLRSKCNLDLFPHAGGEGRVGGGGHAGRGGGCFTMDFCRFPMDLGGFLARGFALFFQLCTFRV